MKLRSRCGGASQYRRSLISHVSLHQPLAHAVSEVSMAQYSPVQSHHSLTTHSLERPPAYDEDDGGDLVHIATVEEKKRRWWRNAFINTAFIASWSVCAVS